eukprot:gene24390-24466_t
MTDDASQLAELDEAMWTFSATDFLPHVAASDALAAQTPVLLTDNDAAELPHRELLINLSRRTPATLDQFARVIEIISSDEEDAAAGRKRYSAYKQQAYPLTHFVDALSDDLLPGESAPPRRTDLAAQLEEDAIENWTDAEWEAMEHRLSSRIMQRLLSRVDF